MLPIQHELFILKKVCHNYILRFTITLTNHFEIIASPVYLANHLANHFVSPMYATVASVLQTFLINIRTYRMINFSFYMAIGKMQIYGISHATFCLTRKILLIHSKLHVLDDRWIYS